MKKIILFLALSISTFTLFTSLKSEKKSEELKKCRYYSYVVYGEAMKNGQLKDLEPVYKGFKIYKSTEDFFACFDHYRGTASGKFKVINIGPYETEAVIYQEINRTREDLEDEGYKKADNFKHTVTGVILYGNKKCD